jgi:hypothetical protein
MNSCAYSTLSPEHVLLTTPPRCSLPKIAQCVDNDPSWFLFTLLKIIGRSIHQIIMVRNKCKLHLIRSVKREKFSFLVSDLSCISRRHILCSRPPSWEFASLSHLRRSAISALAAARQALPLQVYVTTSHHVRSSCCRPRVGSSILQTRGCRCHCHSHSHWSLAGQPLPSPSDLETNKAFVCQ